MGFLDMLKAKDYKSTVERQNQRIDELMSKLNPSQQELEQINQEIKQATAELKNTRCEIEQARESYNNSIDKLKDEKDNLVSQISKLKNEIVIATNNLELQSYGLYEPDFEFCHAEEYKNEITKLRSEQKELLKSELAAISNINWTVNGSQSKGVKMSKDIKKLLLRAFNSECDSLVDKVKYNNLDASMERVRKTSDTISKLGVVMGIGISDKYLNLKLDEIKLAFKYRLKKQQEKEEQRELREQMREEAKLQKEIEEARKKITKEKSHYENALQKINEQLAAQNKDTDPLLQKKIEIEHQLDEIKKNIKDIDYREANQRAGYVYIISNIGSFGENIYKIGMTRRLDPMERVNELGDSSVPFNFDLHAMVFTDDAPKLENALHKAFENKKVNMINHRREFFNVSLEDIKKIVKNNYDKTVEFIDIPDAEQWRMSQDMLKQL